MYQDDLDYAARRLNKTLVRLKSGKAFWVESTSTDLEGNMSHIGVEFPATVREVWHDELDLEPVPLGFVNISDKMVFVMRMPMRKDWHQGLSANAIATCGTVAPHAIKMAWLVQPVENQYPDFKRALQDLKKRESIAFSRDFGVSKGGNDTFLHFRTWRVGKVEGDVPILSVDKLFLQQHLDDVVGG